MAPRDAVGLRDDLWNYRVQPLSIVLMGYKGDIMRRRSPVVLETSKPDVAELGLADFHGHPFLYIYIYVEFLFCIKRYVFHCAHTVEPQAIQLPLEE